MADANDPSLDLLNELLDLLCDDIYTHAHERSSRVGRVQEIASQLRNLPKPVVEIHHA